MVPISDSCLRILALLRAEPWLSADQLARWLQRSTTRLYTDLHRLLKHGFVQRLNPRGVRLDLRAIYALTDRGVRLPATQQGMDERTYRQRFHVSRARHLESLWRIEQVCPVRELLLDLPGEGPTLEFARTLVHEPYLYRRKEQEIQLQGRARLVDESGNALRLVVEWDNFVVEIDRTRESATNLQAKFDEYFYWQLWRGSQRGSEPDPHLLVVTTSLAQAKLISRLLERARRRITPGYRLWVTTFVTLREHKLDEPIWQSNIREPGLHRLPCFVEPRTEESAGNEKIVGESVQE